MIEKPIRKTARKFNEKTAKMDPKREAKSEPKGVNKVTFSGPPSRRPPGIDFRPILRGFGSILGGCFGKKSTLPHGCQGFGAVGGPHPQKHHLVKKPTLPHGCQGFFQKKRPSHTDVKVFSNKNNPPTRMSRFSRAEQRHANASKRK